MKKRVISIALIMCMAMMCLTGCGSKETLKVFLPGEYHSADMIKAFEKENNCKVIIETFDSNEAMYTKFVAGGDAYDILIPSDYMAARLIEEELVQPINKSAITNLSSCPKDVLSADFDKDNTYSVPYFWGTTGIVYDKTQVALSDLEKDGWAIFKNTKYKGHIYVYDSERDSFMMALKNLGYSCNTTNDDEIQAAYDWLIDMAETMKPAIVTDEMINGMADGKMWISFSYSGDAAYVLSENENMGYFTPNEGVNYWIDCMMIPKTSENPELANKFMNFVLTYDAQKLNTEEVGYTSVNEKVMNYEASEEGDYFENEAYIPTPRTQDEIYNNNKKLRETLPELWLKVVMKAK